METKVDITNFKLIYKKINTKFLFLHFRMQEEVWEAEEVEVTPAQNEVTQRRSPIIQKCRCQVNCQAEVWICPYYANHRGNLKPGRLIEYKMFNHVAKCHEKFYNS